MPATIRRMQADMYRYCRDEVEGPFLVLTIDRPEVLDSLRVAVAGAGDIVRAERAFDLIRPRARGAGSGTSQESRAFPTDIG